MKLAIQKSIYSAAMLIAPALVVPPFLFFKRGRKQLGDRFGIWNLKLEESIWLHGASLGEMIGLSQIAKELKLNIPELPIVASATSPSGLSKAKEFAIATKVLPFDHPLYFEKCIKNIAPKAFIFGETEIWPNLLSWLNSQQIPTYLANGRISDRAYKRYSSFKEIVSESLQKISHIFAATEEARDRFIDLGALAEKVSIVPNTKYDISADILPNIAEHRLHLRKSLFRDDLAIVILSSIRPGEEEILFKAIKSLEDKAIRFCYLIAPRHAEKFSYFENKIREFGFSYEKRSELKEPSNNRFLFLDTVGELSSLLPIADLVFVGGTLANYGGHNPLEPANFGIAPVVGPYNSTIKEVVKILKDHDAILEAQTYKDVESILLKLANNNAEITKVGHRAKEASKLFVGGSKAIVSKILNNDGEGRACSTENKFLYK